METTHLTAAELIALYPTLPWLCHIAQRFGGAIPMTPQGPVVLVRGDYAGQQDITLQEADAMLEAAALKDNGNGKQ